MPIPRPTAPASTRPPAWERAWQGWLDAFQPVWHAQQDLWRHTDIPNASTRTQLNHLAVCLRQAYKDFEKGDAPATVVERFLTPLLTSWKQEVTPQAAPTWIPDIMGERARELWAFAFNRIDLGKFRKAAYACDMLALSCEDGRSYLKIAQGLRVGNWRVVERDSSNLDTAAREEIPPKLWVFLRAQKPSPEALRALREQSKLREALDDLPVGAPAKRSVRL